MGSRSARTALTAFNAAAMLTAMLFSSGAVASARQPEDTGKPAATSHKAKAPAKEHKAGNDTKAAPHAKPSSAPTTSPQPLSNADKNPGGANNGGDCGAYCSTRDGSPSHNGNEKGAATGKPCAGCVGKADNKNPKGQAPNGSDHNNGYECDGNNGIAKTNPAHTGCKPASTPPPTCVVTDDNPCTTPPDCVPTDDNPCTTPPDCVPTEDNPCTTPPDCVPSEDNPCTTPPACVATAENPCTTPTAGPTIPTEVEGIRIVKPPVAPAVAPSVLGSRLPHTGLPVGLLLLLGLGSIVAGFAMVVAKPRVR